MVKYEIGNNKDSEYLELQLDLFNKEQKKITQEEDYKKFTIIVKADDTIVGGGVAYSSLYHIGYIDTIWVDPKFRHQSIGSHIMSLLESELSNYGCELCHLDTFDFQAPSFYKNNGYELFGELHHEKQSITEYFFKKKL